MHSRHWQSVATVWALGLAVLSWAPAAHAGFTPVTAIGPAGSSQAQPAVAAAADGSAVLAYEQDGQIHVAIKAPGQLFGAPTVLGPGRQLSLAMAPGGRAVLGWVSPANEGRVALRAPGSPAFTETDPVSPDGTSSVVVAIADDGRAYAAAQVLNGAVMSTYAPTSTTETRALDLFPSGTPTSVAIATQTGGDIAWLLVSVSSTTETAVTARRWSSALGIGPPLELNSDANTTSGTTATTYENRDAVGVPGSQPSFLWNRRDVTRGVGAATASTLFRSDGPLVTPTPRTALSFRSGGFFQEPQRSLPSVTTSPSGSALVGWVDSTGFGDNPAIRLVTRNSSGTWSAPATAVELLNPFETPEVRSFALASLQGGGAQALYPVDEARVITAPLAASGSLTAPEPTLLGTAPAGSSIGEVAAAGNGTGDTALAWAQHSATEGTVQVTLGDGTPPTLNVAPQPPSPAIANTFATPEAVAAFQRTSRNITLEAEASDRWTPTTISWDFGDGTTATGRSVTHQFDPAVDRADITVTARDLAGNVTTERITRTFPSAVLSVLLKGPPPPQVDVALSGLKLNRTRFAVNKPGKPSTRRAKKGATVSFQLTAPTKVEFGVTAKARGYRSSDGKTCTARKPKGVKKPRRCTFDRPLGLAGIAEGLAGSNSFALSGKVAGKPLKPGTYTLTAGIFPRLQSHSSLAATTKFTIVK